MHDRFLVRGVSGSMVRVITGKTGISHIVWDWNGTLLDDIGACVETINRMLLRRSLPALDTARYREVFGFPVRNCYLVLGFDLEREDWDAVAREFHDHYAEVSTDVGLRSGAEPVLRRLHENGTPMSILSACEVELLDRMMWRCGVQTLFDRVYGLTDRYAHSKLDLARRLLADLRLPADAILMVGDTTHDYEVSAELGFQCVLVAGGHQSEERLNRCGCRVLSGPDRLADWLPHAGLVSG
jgi:phosphoglycolate phosphatase